MLAFSHLARSGLRTVSNGVRMDARARKLEFDIALAALRGGRGAEASRRFQKLLQDGSTNPRHISYCGLALATIEGKVRDGRLLCEMAARDAFYDPEMYLNLARVYEHGGRLTEAILTILKGLEIDDRNAELRNAFARVNRRGRPPLRFLPRRHPLNRRLGWILARSRRRGNLRADPR